MSTWTWPRPDVNRLFPVETRLGTVVRKLYPYVNGLRNPMRIGAGDRRVAVHHDGSKGHYFGIYQCFYLRQYEVPAPEFGPAYHRRAVQQRYDALVAAGLEPLIIDCGANIGAASLWFRARYPEARIVAVEPAAGNLALLRRNAEGMGIDVVAAAVGDRDGVARLASDAGGSLSHHLATDGRGAEVSLVSLPTLLARAPEAVPFLLKVDIEGAEKALFAGSPEGNSEALARFPVIVVEPHDFCAPGESISGNVLAFHAREARDLLFASENVFSIDYRALRP